MMSIKLSELLAMINSLSITPSPKRIGVVGQRPDLGLNPEGGCNPKPLHTRGTLAIHGGEEASAYITDFS